MRYDNTEDSTKSENIPEIKINLPDKFSSKAESTKVD